jgi:hypothetical protein
MVATVSAGEFEPSMLKFTVLGAVCLAVAGAGSAAARETAAASPVVRIEQGRISG